MCTPPLQKSPWDQSETERAAQSTARTPETFAGPARRTVMIIQQGARREYIYARQLEQAGMLHSLWCDLAWTPAGAKLVTAAVQRVAPGLVGAVRRRTVIGVPASRLKASALPNLARLARPLVSRERGYDLNDAALAFRLRHSRVRGADVIVNYFGNGGSYLDHAKRGGARIITDFISHPRFWQIVDAERLRWPGVEATGDVRSDVAVYEHRVERLLRISDIYLCPSQSVADGLSGFQNFQPDRVRVVPYGYSGAAAHEPATIEGQVLLAGSYVGLAKGLPYLAEAARILYARDPSIRIRIAGVVAPEMRRLAGAEHIHFLGQLDAPGMAKALAETDVFCLPSLAEGSPSSIFEALTNGLPVVTTASSGSVVRHEVEGYIVPERDAAAIATALVKIIADRTLRNSMSVAARASAHRFSAENCGRLFLNVVRELTA